MHKIFVKICILYPQKLNNFILKYCIIITKQSQLIFLNLYIILYKNNVPFTDYLRKRHIVTKSDAAFKFRNQLQPMFRQRHAYAF